MALGVVSLSVSNTFLLLPPAARDANRLVMIYGHSPSEPIDQISYPDYQYYRENNHVFSGIAATPISLEVQTELDGNREIKIVDRPVSDNYFIVMGIQPYRGRLFLPGDDTASAPIAVMT